MKGVTPTEDVVDVINSQISIHTPVKGVTDQAAKDQAAAQISIHTPVKGVTTFGYLTGFDVIKFQSTHP